MIKENYRFRLSFFVTISAIVLISFISSISILLIQKNISLNAEKNLILEKRYSEILRKLDYINERISYIHKPIVMQARVSRNLSPIQDNQIIWVEDSLMADTRSDLGFNNKQL